MDAPRSGVNANNVTIVWERYRYVPPLTRKLTAAWQTETNIQIRLKPFPIFFCGSFFVQLLAVE